MEAVDVSTGVLLGVEHDSFADGANKLLLQLQHKLQRVLDGRQFRLPGAHRARRPHTGLLGHQLWLLRLPRSPLRLQTGLRSFEWCVCCGHEPVGGQSEHRGDLKDLVFILKDSFFWTLRKLCEEAEPERQNSGRNILFLNLLMAADNVATSVMMYRLWRLDNGYVGYMTFLFYTTSLKHQIISFPVLCPVFT